MTTSQAKITSAIAAGVKRAPPAPGDVLVRTASTLLRPSDFGADELVVAALAR